MKESVLIVGAGPSGLTLALSLLRNGISVRIVSKELKSIIGQRGCGIQPRTLEIQKMLGILPEIEKLAHLAPPVELFTSPAGREPVKVFDLNDILTPTAFYPYINPVLLGQDDHEELLRSIIQRDYNVAVEFGTEFLTLEHNPENVIVKLLKVAEGQESCETATFDWVIGADGARSAVRKQIGLEFVGTSRMQTFVAGDIYVKKGLDQKRWPFWGNDYMKKLISLRPYGDNRFNLVVGGNDLEHEKIASSREEFIQAFYDVTGRTDVEFGDLIWIGTWRPNIRMVNKLGEGRVYLVGDAAHVHTPGGGQGMNAGIQDSFNLAWKLALVHKGMAPKNLLDTYTEERVPVIAAMLDNSTVVFDSSMKDGASGSMSRGFELRQLGVNYRGSSIVLDGRYSVDDEKSDPYRSGDDGKVRAGDRAPEASGLITIRDGAISTNLLTLFKPTSHSIIIFVGESDKHSSTLKKLPSYPDGTVQTIMIHPQPMSSAVISEQAADYVCVDQLGFAYKHYRVGVDGAIVVVRPDGYIGAFVEDVSEVIRHFKDILV